jgi:hypothetical protein
VHITESPLGGDARVSFAYDPDVVSVVKSLPSRSRSWDAESRVWWVDSWHIDQLVDLLESEGYRVVVTGATRKASAPPPRTAPAENWADALMQAVGSARVDPVHRALVRVLHPDVATGDTALMQQLNGARDRWAVTR